MGCLAFCPRSFLNSHIRFDYALNSRCEGLILSSAIQTSLEKENTIDEDPKAKLYEKSQDKTWILLTFKARM